MTFMTNFKTLLVTRDAENTSVAILTLNRPEAMNSFNTVMFRELQRAYVELDKDPSVRVIIVTGAGRTFCVGADISEGFSSTGPAYEPSMHEGIVRDAGGELVLDMFKIDTPIIGAINGHAAGIGATMTMPMDIRICSEKTKWAFPFARRGIVFDGAASWFLPRLVGWAKANEWILKGDVILPEEMVRAGYVSEVHPAEMVLSRALELARDIAQNCSPTSTAINKRLLRKSMMGHGLLEDAAFMSHITESRYLNTAFKSTDCEEGVRAFLEKRPPNFADRTD